MTQYMGDGRDRGDIYKTPVGKRYQGTMSSVQGEKRHFVGKHWDCYSVMIIGGICTASVLLQFNYFTGL